MRSWFLEGEVGSERQGISQEGGDGKVCGARVCYEGERIGGDKE